MCHVNYYIHLPESYPKPSCAGDWADCNSECHRNDWFHLDAKRSCYCPSGVKNTELALERARLPMPSLAWNTNFLIQAVQIMKWYTLGYIY
jgi:hypothetical protein